MNKQDVRDVIDKVIERLVREEFRERLDRIEQRLDALESARGLIWSPGIQIPDSPPVVTGTQAYAVGELSGTRIWDIGYSTGEYTITTSDQIQFDGASHTFTTTDDLS